MASDEQHDDSLDPALRRVLTEAYLVGMDVEVAARHLWRLREESERIAASAGPAPYVPRMARTRQRAAALLSVILLLAMSGVAVAGSGHAVPGELLYPVKRGTERVQLLAAWRPATDAELSLRFARLRLSEAAMVGPTRPSWTPRLIADAVRSVDRAEQLGGATVAREAAEVRHEAGQAVVALAASTPEVSEELAVLVERLGVGAPIAAASPPPPSAAPPGEKPGVDEPSETADASERKPSGRHDGDVPPRREVARVEVAPVEPGDASGDEVPSDGSADHDGAGHEPSPRAGHTGAGAEPAPHAPSGGSSGDQGSPQTEPAPEGDGGDAGGGKHMPTTSELAARFDARDGGSQPAPET